MAKGINLTGATVSARDDAFIYHLVSGMSGIFKYANMMDHTVISSNLIKIKDGMAQIQGRNYIVYPGEVIDVEIENGTQSNKRYDIIVLEFSKSSNSEVITFKVVKGTPTAGNPVDPILIQQDTLSSGTKFQLPLYRVKLNGINIDGVDDLRKFIPSLSTSLQVVSETDDYVEVDYSL